MSVFVNHRRRAAATLLVVVAAGCSSAGGSVATIGSPATVPDTTTAATAPPTGTSTPPVPTTAPRECSDTSVATYDFIGTMHTVVPSDQPIMATITPVGGFWCTGGPGEAEVTLTNTGVGAVHVQSPQLVLADGAAKWTLQQSPPLDLAAGESQTFAASFTVPGVNPGSYSVFVYGFDGSATVTVEGPPACVTNDLAATGNAAGAAMSNVRTDITITNIGNRPCLLPEPEVIEGLRPPDAPTQLAFGRGTYFGDPPPLASHVLPVNGQAVLYLGTGTGCLDGTRPSISWGGLRLTFISSPSFDATTVDVTVDIDTTCGFSVSSFGRV